MAADAAPSRLFVPDLPDPGSSVALSASESHYVSRVCRLRAGAALEATDGRGARARVRLLEAGPHARIEVLETAREARERRGMLLCGAPEGERADWLVEKLAELGLERFQPVDLERARWRGGAARRERWERLAVAALRQSRRAFRMEVGEPQGLEEALSSVPDGAGRWLADAGGAPAARLTAPGPGVAVGVVGASPGLTPPERARLAERGYVAVALAASRLRTETAALAWAAWWSGGLS